MLRSRQAAICCPDGARIAQLIDEERRLKTVHGNGAGPLASPEAAIAEAIARADVQALETLLEAADANQAKLIEAGLKRLNPTADQLAESGDKGAQTAWKLLTNNLFKKLHMKTGW